jgi:hypothetical protein
MKDKLPYYSTLAKFCERSAAEPERGRGAHKSTHAALGKNTRLISVLWFSVGNGGLATYGS